MNPSDKKKAVEGVAGIHAFLSQFGEPDAHTKLVLETIFEVMNEQETEFSDLSIHDEKRQEGVEGHNNLTNSKQGIDKVDGRDTTKSAPKVGKPNQEDYP